jgi:coenzyme F420-reducing hydrogenase gamma subunit
MNMAQSLIVIAVGACSLLGIVAGLIRHLVKYYLNELRPDNNGGHNLRGRVDRIEIRVDEIYRLLLEDRA